MKKKLLILLLSILTIASSIGFKNIQVNATDSALPEWTEEELADFLEMAKHPREPFTIEVPIGDNSGKKGKAIGDMYNMTITEDSNLGYRAANPNTGGSNFGMFGYIHNDSTGQYVFCLDPFTIVSTGNGYTAITPDSFIGNPTLLRTIRDIATFGNQLTKETGDLAYYRAAQLMIWTSLGRSVELTSGFNGSTVNIDWAKNAIQGRINAFHVDPSFTNMTVNLKIGESYTFTDTNGVFSNFNVSQNNGNLQISQNGNQVTVTATSSSVHGESTISFEAFGSLVAPSFVYQKPGSQTMGSFGQSDPKITYLNINVIPFGKATVLKNNDSGVAIPGTVFDFSPNADMSGSARYTTGSEGTFTVENLLAGTYFYREVSVPAPLILDTTIRSINVVVGEEATSTVTNQTATGQIEINKAEDPTSIGYINQKVVGARYEIKNSSNVLVDTITTNAQGYAISKVLPLGTYSVQEVFAPVGYILDPTIHNATIAYKDQTTSVTTTTLNLTNVKAHGQIEINKVEDPTSPQYVMKMLANAVYEVKNSLGTVVATLTTDSSGYARTGLLPLGTYTIKEVTAPTGYNLDPATHSVTLAYANQTTPVVTSTQNLTDKVISGKAHIIKTSDFGASLINNATYGVYTKDDVQVASFKTGISGLGMFVTPDLRYGEYYVQELEAPNGFYLNTTKYIFTIDQNGETEYIPVTNERVRAKLEAIKIDGDTADALEGAGFSIVNENNEVVEFTINKNGREVKETVFYTDQEGRLFIDGYITAGTYKLREAVTPEGYVTMDDVAFTLDASTELSDLGIVGKVLNLGNVENKAIKATFTKYKLGTEEFVEGATMQIINKETNEVFSEFITSNEPITLTNIPVGTYILKEIKTPLGYATMADLVFVVEAREDNEVIFYNDVTKVQISKVEIGKDVELPGSTLQVINDKDEVLHEWVSTDTAHYIEMLPVGKYNLRETLATPGYGIANDLEFEVLDNGEIQSFKMENQPTITVFEKRDIETKEILDGGEFAIYKLREIQPIVPIVENSEQEETTEPTEEIQDNRYEFEGKLYEKEIVVNFENLLDKDGESTDIFEYLTPGMYLVEEVKAPTGYDINEPVIFEVTATNEPLTVTQYDAKTVYSIIGKKVDSNTHAVLPGAEFTLYDENMKEIETTVANQEGLVEFKVTFGRYFVKETKAPVGYKLSDEVIEIDVTGTEDADYLFEFELPNTPLPVAKLPSTGLSDPYSMLGGSMMFAGLGLAIITSRKKEDVKNNLLKN